MLFEMLLIAQDEGNGGGWNWGSAFNSGMLLAVGILFVIMAMFSMMRKRVKRNATRLTPREEIEQMQQHRGMRGDLEDLMVEIEQLAKRMGAQLDNKSIALEKLLREADLRIEQLQRLRDEVGGQAGGQSGGGGLSGGGMNHVEQAEEKVVWPDDPVARRIYELADQGMDTQAISQEVGEHIGKVELILALRQ